MRRNAAAETIMTELARIAQSAEARRGEANIFRPCAESIIARHYAGVDSWMAAETAKLLALLPGGVQELAAWVQDRATERLTELDREAAERRRAAAAAEAERVALARSKAARATPIDALRLAPRAADVSTWVTSQLSLIDALFGRAGDGDHERNV